MYWARIKSIAVNGRQVPAMPWEELLVPEGSLVGCPRHLTLPDSVLEPLRGLHQAVMDLLGSGTMQLTDMTRVLKKHANELIDIHRIFKLDLVFLEVKSQDVLRERVFWGRWAGWASQVVLYLGARRFPTSEALSLPAHHISHNPGWTNRSSNRIDRPRHIHVSCLRSLCQPPIHPTDALGVISGSVLWVVLAPPPAGRGVRGPVTMHCRPGRGAGEVPARSVGSRPRSRAVHGPMYLVP